MPGSDPERPRLVRRRRDDLPGPSRVAVAADHDGSTRQLRAAQDLDRGEELVEVDVEHPVASGLRTAGRISST